MRTRFFLLCFIILKTIACYSQLPVKYAVCDSFTRKPIPFAVIKFGEGSNGTIADLDGIFRMDSENMVGIRQIEVSSLGYQPRKFSLPLTQQNIYIPAKNNMLMEVVVKPQQEKIYRILNTAIAHKKSNNPELYDWYRCKVYYKMALDVYPADSSIHDTSADAKEFKDFIDNQHLMMTETYSKRTWKRPQHLQEDVLGSRFYGLKKSLFTGLITDVLPFHSYNDYISLNNKDYYNPLSNGYKQHYKFQLSDEILQGNDTLWVISFSPKSNNGKELSGKLYISSHNYAIANITAKATDTLLKRDILIEQQYRLVNDNGIEHWFPTQLNYIIDLTMKSKRNALTYHLKGNSLIDSVTFREDNNFRFDKRHTVKLQDYADELSDSLWNKMRPVSLDKKEQRTYVVLDSIGEKLHLDKGISYLSKVPEAKVPVSIVDIDLKRLISSNYYERYRFGLGLQTNERLIKWVSVGGWAGYGINDARWKYGAFTEFYLDKNREFIIKAGIENDISDPGRVRLNNELDKNYLRSYLLRRVDDVNEQYFSVKKKLGYLRLELSGRQQKIMPKYTYDWINEGNRYQQFNASELSLNFRYAYAERTAPIFGHYINVGTKYPILYGNITYGSLEAGTQKLLYTKVVIALAWQKHLNRIGNEKMLIEGGKIWSDNGLPLSKIFAGNGFRNSQQSFYTFGGMLTMYPYEFYTDQFVNLIYRHEFDWKLYKIDIKGSKVNSAPAIAMQYNALYGTLRNRSSHQSAAFEVPDNTYHEVGAMLNGLLRLNYLNIYYLSFNVGYFYHLSPTFDLEKNGKLAYGIGVEF